MQRSSLQSATSTAEALYRESVEAEAALGVPSAPAPTSGPPAAREIVSMMDGAHAAEEHRPSGPTTEPLRCSRSGGDFNIAAPFVDGINPAMCRNVVVMEVAGSNLCAYHAQMEGYDVQAQPGADDRAEFEEHVRDAEVAVRGGEWCAENRAAGRGPCGCS